MSFEPLAFEAGLVLESSVAPGVGVTGDGEELRRLCAILLDNACKYCEPGGRILDPFAGSGTTILAAVEEGYEAVGIEVTDTYYALGTERVRSALETGRQKEGGDDETGN